MGLFGKKKKTEIRRFTFLAEQIFSIRQIGMVAVGRVSGKVCGGDSVYLYHPEVPLTAAKIDKIELAPGKAAKEAENCQAALYFENMKPENIRKYTVISNIRGNQGADLNEAVENPQLRGLLCGYTQFGNDPDYRNLLNYSIAHARFLMAVYVDREPTQNGDGTATFTAGATMSFPLVSNTDGTSAVPVFTDWETLGKWQNVFDETHPPKTVVQTFGGVAAISFNGNDGIVVNPFDETPLFCSNDFLKKIMDSEGYKREFGTSNK